MVIFAFTMKQNYDIKVKTASDYNEFVGVENTLPYVSVIHYDELSPIRHSRILWGVYGIFLLEDTSEQLSYGSGKYDYQAGSIVCVAPAQIGGTADDGSSFQRRGWALLFSPELFHGAAYEKELLRLEFFRYHVNNALSITLQERQFCETLLQMLQSELNGANRKDLITKTIELILAYCSSFFERQFPITSTTKRSHIVSRLEQLLDDYYKTEKQYSNGLPTVRFCADNLCLAPNYLGDLIRQETGDSANHFIGRYVIRHAKDLLMSGKSVTEAAYALGFDFPSHFSRFFNRLVGITPSAYVRRVLKIEK